MLTESVHRMGYLSNRTMIWFFEYLAEISAFIETDRIETKKGDRMNDNITRT